MNIFIHQENR